METKRKITLHVKELAAKQGITSGYQLQKALNITPKLAYSWFNGETKMIALESISALCEVLKCTPNDLFDFDGQAETTNAVKSIIVDDNNAVSNSVKDNTQTVVDSSASDSSETQATTTAVFDDSSEKLLTLAQVGERLGLTRKRVNDYVNAGTLPATKIKRQNFVSESDLIEFQTARKG